MEITVTIIKYATFIYLFFNLGRIYGEYKTQVTMKAAIDLMKEAKLAYELAVVEKKAALKFKDETIEAMKEKLK